MGRISHIILKLGRSPVVWEGFPKEYNSEVPRETLVIAWDSNYQSAADLVESGFTLVNSSFDPMYIVTPRRMYEANAILDWNTRRWTQSADDQTQPKRYIIVPDSARVVGGQLCAWGDYLVEYSSNEVAAAEEFANVRERISAASERMWSNSSDFDKVVFNDAAKAVDQIVGKIALDY